MMALTTQQTVLERVQERFGKTGFTVHHVHYKLVGFERGGRKVFCIGQSWDEAIQCLEGKAR
jgi:hypothetical protein